MIKNGHIAWVNGPYACGMYNDMKIFFECGLREELEENERVEADDGYRAYDPEFTKTRTGFSSKYREKPIKEMQNTIRARHETVNKRFKQFSILCQPFRHTLENHGSVFRAIAVLTQLAIESGENLFEVEYGNS